ncbi:MAG: ribosomal protein [Paenibacillaceae bacterium]|jgi:uncharacterized protein YsxB (DUF464 family)|nr:ribosomal protein [Paenibacillaceae bacterium]
MIEILVNRRQSDRSIRSFQVSGHAEFDKPGKDLVCAGVSSVTVGTVNAIEEVVGVMMEHRMAKGLLSAALPEGITEEQERQAGLLLESMLVMLRAIKETYHGKYISMKESDI